MKRLQVIFLVLLAALLVLQAGYSLRWPIAHDEAPLFYEAFLMRTEGRVPYHDIFDFQMPGSFAAFYVLGRLGGFNALRIRALDLLILAALVLITYRFMCGFGKIPALLGGVLFGLKYLQGGPSLSLQREYLLLVFLALAVWVGMRDALTPRHRLGLGFLFGLAAVIKPHAALGLLPFLVFDIWDMVNSRGIPLFNAAIKSMLPALIGFAIPVAITTTWLAFTHALTPFLSIALNYWPLYSQINGQMEITTGAARWAFIFNQLWRLGGNGIWLIPAALGVYLNRNRKVYLLAGLALCYAIYPAFSGQFFPYHYIPFVYIIILLASLSLEQSSTSSLPAYLLPLASLILLAVILMNVRPSATFIRQIEGKPVATSTDRATEIAAYLEKNLKPGDTVQPLDWTGGTLLAMLEARAHIATPYVFDFYFYHSVSTAYIQALRTDFMNDLHKSRPRFIVEVTALDKPWVTGPDTTRDFPALRTFLDENYSVTIRKADYIIYERK